MNREQLDNWINLKNHTLSQSINDNYEYIEQTKGHVVKVNQISIYKFLMNPVLWINRLISQ